MSWNSAVKLRQMGWKYSASELLHHLKSINQTAMRHDWRAIRTCIKTWEAFWTANKDTAHRCWYNSSPFFLMVLWRLTHPHVLLQDESIFMAYFDNSSGIIWPYFLEAFLAADSQAQARSTWNWDVSIYYNNIICITCCYITTTNPMTILLATVLHTVLAYMYL